MLSGCFIMSTKGEILISRLYRTDIKRSLADLFRVHVIASPTSTPPPILTLGSTTFYHIRHENLYLVAVSKLNVNAALVFEVLARICRVGREYFGKFSEDEVKGNFVLVYELLDEILDAGYPQTTDASTLKLFITTATLPTRNLDSQSSSEASKVSIQATGAIAWRRPDIKYRKNEAFCDVVESVNYLGSVNGSVLRADVAGQVLMRAYLTGMPECKFGMNDRVMDASAGKKREDGTVLLDDVQFHQCVKLGRFESDRTISFVPPDGEFELMKYRSTEAINLPFRVSPTFSLPTPTRAEYRITVRSQFAQKVYAQNVMIRIPTPPNTSATKINTSGGKAKYVGADNAVVWKITKFQGQMEYVISLDCTLHPTTSGRPASSWSRPPISMDFQVLMFTASGLVVRFLKVFEKSNYNAVKWVRYMTKAGSYQIRF